MSRRLLDALAGSVAPVAPEEPEHATPDPGEPVVLETTDPGPAKVSSALLVCLRSLVSGPPDRRVRLVHGIRSAGPVNGNPVQQTVDTAWASLTLLVGALEVAVAEGRSSRLYAAVHDAD